MAVSYPFRSWLQYQNDAFYFNENTQLPDRTKFYGLLANYVSGTLNDLSSKAQVISSEIVKTSTNNYSRFNVVFDSASFYDNSNRRWQMPVASWTASFPEAIQYDSVILMADALPATSLSVAILAGTPAILRSAIAHNLSNNDEIVITADATGTLPTPLSANNIYYVRDPSGLDFNISIARDGEKIGLSSAGSQIRVRYAKGRLVGIRAEDNLVTLPANTPHSWSFFLSNAAYFGIGAGS